MLHNGGYICITIFSTQFIYYRITEQIINTPIICAGGANNQ